MISDFEKDDVKDKKKLVMMPSYSLIAWRH